MDRQAYNSLLALDRQGQILARYDKVKLVPFGEYLPFGDVLNHLGIDSLAPASFSLSAGARRRKPIQIAHLPPFLPLICYEIIFPEMIVPGQQARWILNITNDAWFGKTAGPQQHLAAAQFRAVESALPVVARRQ